MAGPRVMILGAGFGGLAAAHTLRAAADVVLVDSSPMFQMGFRKLWFLDGRSRPDEGVGPRGRLPEAGIPFRQAVVEGIDPDARRVRVDGEDEPYDYLVIALGAQPRLDLVPGEADGAANLYTRDGAVEAGERLRTMRGGRVLIAIAGLPYKCPPAPYEAAFLIDDLLRREARRDAFEIEVLTPQPMSLPVAGPAACAVVEGRLGSRGITFRPKTTVAGLAPGAVALETGDRVEADLLIVVPPHRPPQVVAGTGLGGEGGWMRVDPATLRTEDDRVFAIGDVVQMTTGAGQPFPKAGVFAEAHGVVVGRNIAAMASDREPDASFEGVGHCFLEVGGGMATMVRGNFLADPPEVTLAEPAAEHLQTKLAFERERLEAWFPG